MASSEPPEHKEAEAGILLQRVQAALYASHAVDFLTSFVPEFYASCAPGQEDQARQLVRSAFLILERAKASDNYAELLVAADHIYSDVFKRDAPDFWFTQVHHEYKIHRKPRLVVPMLESNLRGSRILDVGGGRGYLALELQRQGYYSALTEVLDYRAPETRGLPFRKMETADAIPYADDEFTSVVFFEVLHHVGKGIQLPLLREARRVAPRIVVVENSYGPLDGPQINLWRHLEDQQATSAYLAMSAEDQLHTLILMDFFVNISAKGILDMSIPFQFKPIADWLLLFKRAGLGVENIFRLGFMRNTLNRNLQVYFVLNRSETAESNSGPLWSRWQTS